MGVGDAPVSAHRLVNSFGQVVDFKANHDAILKEPGQSASREAQATHKLMRIYRQNETSLFGAILDDIGALVASGSKAHRPHQRRVI
jgi:hypothetical protein